MSVNTRLSNKELKLTKPAQAMELRSLTPVFDAPLGVRSGSRPTLVGVKGR
jgi:hypothetical protein